MGEGRRDEPERARHAQAAAWSGTGNLRGILAMVVATFSFCCGDAVMKLIAAELPTGELVFIRGLVGVIVMTGVVMITGALAEMRRALVPAMGLRATGDIGGALFFQSALARMPFPDLMSILQITPLSLTAASAIFLGEKVGWRRWTAVAVGLFGALLIIKPGSSAFNWWAIAAILSVLSGTLRDISTRRIDVTIPPQAIMLLSLVAVTGAAAVCSLFESWRVPSTSLVLALAGAAMFSLLGQLATIIAVRSGEISAVAPFRYAGIVWSLLLGLMIWNHLPDGLSLVGIAIIVSAGLYTLFREQKLRRLARMKAIEAAQSPAGPQS